MTTDDLFRIAARAGIRINTNGSKKLLFTADSPPPQEIVDLLDRNKAALLRHLTTGYAEVLTELPEDLPNTVLELRTYLAAGRLEGLPGRRWDGIFLMNLGPALYRATNEQLRVWLERVKPSVPDLNEENVLAKSPLYLRSPYERTQRGDPGIPQKLER